MIVRVLGRGQFRLDEEACARINTIDDRVQAAVEAGDDEAFHAALAELVGAIEASGTPLATDEFEGSDAVVPDVGTTLEETRDLLSAEGLIPD